MANSYDGIFNRAPGAPCNTTVPACIAAAKAARADVARNARTEDEYLGAAETTWQDFCPCDCPRCAPDDDDGPQMDEPCGPDGCGAGPGEPCAPSCEWAASQPAPTPFSHYAVRRPDRDPGHKGSINPGFCCLLCGAGFDFGCNCPDE